MPTTRTPSPSCGRRPWSQSWRRSTVVKPFCRRRTRCSAAPESNRWLGTGRVGSVRFVASVEGLTPPSLAPGGLAGRRPRDPLGGPRRDLAVERGEVADPILLLDGPLDDAVQRIQELDDGADHPAILAARPLGRQRRSVHVTRQSSAVITPVFSPNVVDAPPVLNRYLLVWEPGPSVGDTVWTACPSWKLSPVSSTAIQKWPAR